MATPDLNVATNKWTSLSPVLLVTNAMSDFASCAAASNSVVWLLSVRVRNVTAAPHTITAQILRAATGYRDAFQVTIPANGAYDLIDKSGPAVLLEGDKYQLQADANAVLEALGAGVQVTT